MIKIYRIKVLIKIYFFDILKTKGGGQMELVLIVALVVVAIILIISDSRISVLKEDKRFLMEENSWLKNNLKGMIFVVENLADNRKNNNGSVRSRESRQRKNKSNKIFIFNDSEPEETQELRNLLKKNYINEIMLIDFEVLSSKLSSTDNFMIEESYLVNKNLHNLPIIFYGGNEADFKDFLEHYGWEKRKDLEWVEYPFKEEKLKQALNEIRNK